MSSHLLDLRSLRPAVGRVMHDWRAGAERREAVAVLRQVLSGLPPVEGLPAPALWGVRRVLRTETDVTVVVLGTEAQGDLVIARIGPRGDAPSALARNHASVVRLLDDPRLAELRPLLPRPVAMVRHDGRPLALERALPGRPAGDLLACGRGDRVVELGMAVMALLHVPTSSPATITGELVTEWTSRSIGVVSSALAAANRGSTSAVDRLGDRLRGSLEGNNCPLGWTHGDLWAGNLLLDVSGSRVVGLVDWDAASERGWPAVDLAHLVLTTLGHSRRIHFGAVVADVLRGSRPDELSPVHEWLPGTADGMVAAVLLAWLQHAGSVLSKQPTHAARTQWLAHNVEPVLDLV